LGDLFVIRVADNVMSPQAKLHGALERLRIHLRLETRL
jgi:hypothetical protein